MNKELDFSKDEFYRVRMVFTHYKYKKDGTKIPHGVGRTVIKVGRDFTNEMHSKNFYDRLVLEQGLMPNRTYDVLVVRQGMRLDKFGSEVATWVERKTLERSI